MSNEESSNTDMRKSHDLRNVGVRLTFSGEADNFRFVLGGEAAGACRVSGSMPSTLYNAVGYVLLGRTPLEIGQRIVSAATVFVVHLGQTLRVWYKRHSHHAMYLAPIGVAVFRQHNAGVPPAVKYRSQDLAFEDTRISPSTVGYTARYAPDTTQIRNFIATLLPYNGFPVLHNPPL